PCSANDDRGVQHATVDPDLVGVPASRGPVGDQAHLLPSAGLTRGVLQWLARTSRAAAGEHQFERAGFAARRTPGDHRALVHFAVALGSFAIGRYVDVDRIGTHGVRASHAVLVGNQVV